MSRSHLVLFGLFLVLPLSLLLWNLPSGAPPSSAGAFPASGWLLSPAVLAAADFDQGRHIFLRDCAHCHGPNGGGLSPNRETLHPAPADLTSFELALPFIVRAVRDGIPGTDMPGWRLGSDYDVFVVAAYAASLSRPDSLAQTERYASSETLHEAGRRVYTMHCVSCHGQRGAGDGPDAVHHLPRPASFEHMRPSYAAARRVIENGVYGTAMPSWPLLTAPEIQALTFYIRTLYTDSSVVGARP